MSARTRCASSSSSGSARRCCRCFNEKVMCGARARHRRAPAGSTRTASSWRWSICSASSLSPAPLRVDHLAVLATAAVRDASDGASLRRRGRTPMRRAGRDHRRGGGGAAVGGRSARRDSGRGRNCRRSRRRQCRAGSGRTRHTVAGGPVKSARASVCRSARFALPNSAIARKVCPKRSNGRSPALRCCARRPEKRCIWSAAHARAIARLHMEHTQYPLHIIHRYTIARREAEGFLDIIGRQSRNSLERITTISRKRLDVVPLAAIGPAQADYRRGAATASSFPLLGCARATPMGSFLQRSGSRIR